MLVWLFADNNNITRKINDAHFKDLLQISENTFEVFSSKIKIKMDVPIQVGCAVYDLAKLRMLEFYYDFIDKYWSFWFCVLPNGQR